MKENTNKAIAYNSIILYGKMVINTICVLISTRFALKFLGEDDFGLFSVLGGIITFISIFNIIMIQTSNRFIAVAIGKGDLIETNRQFNVNLFVHFLIALLALAIVYPVGDWYIPRFINYNGSLSNAMMVYLISIVCSIISFIGVPFNGLLMAKERFWVFSLVDVIVHIIKLVGAWILLYHFNDKLLLYALLMGFTTALPTVVYIIYCSVYYPKIVRLRFVRDKQMYKNVFGFSGWVAFGAIAQIARSQGAALIVNNFFNTVMNSAMGLASSVNHYVGLFSNNVRQPMAPQITKSYASGNIKRTDELLVMSTKYTFLLTLLCGSIFLAEPEWLLSLWLGKVPPFTSVFLVLFIVDNLAQALNAGCGIYIYATGQIKIYQLLSCILNILSVVLGYFILRLGFPAYYLLVAYISVSIITFFMTQFVLGGILKYDNSILWRQSYLPSVIVTILFVVFLFIPISIHPLFHIILAFCYLLMLEYFIGLSKKERNKLQTFIKGLINKKKGKISHNRSH